MSKRKRENEFVVDNVYFFFIEPRGVKYWAEVTVSTEVKTSR